MCKERESLIDLIPALAMKLKEDDRLDRWRIQTLYLLDFVALVPQVVANIYFMNKLFF